MTGRVKALNPTIRETPKYYKVMVNGFEKSFYKASMWNDTDLLKITECVDLTTEDTIIQSNVIESVRFKVYPKQGGHMMGRDSVPVAPCDLFVNKNTMLCLMIEQHYYTHGLKYALMYHKDITGDYQVSQEVSDRILNRFLKSLTKKVTL